MADFKTGSVRPNDINFHSLEDQEAIEEWHAGPARYQEWPIAPVFGARGSAVQEEG